MNPRVYIVLFLFAICTTCGRPYNSLSTKYTPVLMDRAELESSIKLMEPQPIRNTGKIYIKNHLLFINEKFRGIHIINNFDPENPVVIGFISIPGNVDISMDANYLYADNAVDLVTIKYINNSIQITDRIKNVFPELSPPDLPGYIPHEFTKEERPENTVIINWE